jgi:coenzyme F420-dependent glucose-6-phosphate dehydrogenase
VTFEGEYYRTDRATIYDRPEEPVPVYIAASGPLAAKLAGRAGDGFICTSGKAPELYQQLLASVEEGAQGRDASIARMIEVKLSYDHDLDYARDACRWWAALALTPDEKTGVEDPIEMERLADALPTERAASRFIVSDDPDEVVAMIGAYVELGFTELVLHHPGDDQRRALELFARDVLPGLRELRAHD